MRLIEVIRAGKANIQIGNWGNGHIPPRHFALRAKPSSFNLGPRWDWLVIRFEALNHSFRVLVLLNSAKQIYRAVLAVEVDGVAKVLCLHEFHASEPGWHCHFVGDADDAPEGWRRRGMHRRPRGAKLDDDFGVTKADAAHCAIRVFGIEPHGTLI